VLEASNLVDGSVYAGLVYTKDLPNGLAQRTPGKVIEDPTVARKMLPTMDGFCFGSLEYDEHYYDDVVRTRDWIRRMLTDSVTGTRKYIYYSSSW
jgi:hypothetical protein